MSRKRRGWYERDEVERVTAKWVNANVKLTNREIELLDIINKRKLVRRDMLEVISPSYRNLGKNRTIIINKSISKMFRKMCVDKIHEPQTFMRGNTPAILSIDRAGSIILGISHKRRIKHNKTIINGKEYIRRELPINYNHINGVNKLEVDTINFCTNNDCIMNYWTVEQPISFHYGSFEEVLIPDIKFGLSLRSDPKNNFNAYVEFDTGLDSIRYTEPPVIKSKVEKYKRYKLSNIWCNEFDSFPFLLFVTKDKSRVNFFNNVSKNNGIIGIGIYYKNYVNFLERLNQ